MGKYLSIGAVFMVVVGFIILITLNFTGDTQSHSVIEPVNASVTVGEMRTNPHNTYQLSEDSYGLVGEKGMLASDLMVEVTNELIEDKLDNSIYMVWWVFKDSEGDLVEGLKPSIIEAGREGDLKSGEVIQAKDIIDTQLSAGVSASVEDDGVRDAVIQEATFKINRYDNTQVNEDGSIRDINVPTNSTTYKWSLFVDELADEDYPQGEGFNVENIKFDHHIGAEVKDLGESNYSEGR